MKFLGKLILWLLVALLLVIVGAWFLLQTHWGARQASAWLSNGTGWQVSFDAMDHDFSSSSCAVAKRHLWPGRQAGHAGGENGRYWLQHPPV
jgi:autotransporter translocation and assembly factor TamB